MMTIFLDFDGTLIDSRYRVYKLFTDLSKQNVLGFDEYWHFKRDMQSNEWLLEHILGFNHGDIQMFRIEWFKNIESPEYLKYDVLFEFTLSTLRALADGDYKCVLITARQSKTQAIQQLMDLEIYSFFDDVLVTGGSKSKLDVLSAYTVATDDLLIGDTGLDVQTAKSLGIKSVAVLTGFRNRVTLESYNPDYLEESLLSFLDNNNFIS